MLTLTVLLSLSAPQMSFAPPADPAKVQFVNMDGSVVNGAILVPQATWSDSQKRAEFTRLLSLKKSFLPTLTASGTSPLRG